jgi:hypothetical protein
LKRRTTATRQRVLTPAQDPVSQPGFRRHRHPTGSSAGRCDGTTVVQHRRQQRRAPSPGDAVQRLDQDQAPLPALAVGAGLEVMQQLMEAYVAAACGPWVGHDAGRTATLCGTTSRRCFSSRCFRPVLRCQSGVGRRVRRITLATALGGSAGPCVVWARSAWRKWRARGSGVRVGVVSGRTRP